MTKFIFLIILTFLISCGSRKNLKYTIEPSLREKNYPIIIFPAKLLYPHGGFDILKNTLMFQDGFKYVDIPFYLIETTSTDNFFNNSNLYTLLKSKNIDYKSVLILQPIIKITEESTSIQIEDKKGNVTESANNKEHIEIVIEGYIGDNSKLYFTYKDKIVITPFQIELEQDDPTHYLSELLKKIGKDSSKLIKHSNSSKFSETNKKTSENQENLAQNWDNSEKNSRNISIDDKKIVKSLSDINIVEYSADKTGKGFHQSKNSSQKDLEIFFLKKYIQNR